MGDQDRKVSQHLTEDWNKSHRVVGNSSSPRYDTNGLPIPVTIPVELGPGIKVVYTTRLGGVSQGDYASLNLSDKGGDSKEAVAANRRALVSELGLPIRLVSQIHSSRVYDADQPDPASLGRRLPEADAQVTRQRDQFLGIFAADCLPVFLADPQAGVIGAAHCGRKGLMAGIIESTLALMVDKGADPAHILATLGPSICSDCYQVDAELAETFNQRFPGTAGESRFGGFSIDIAGAARISLRASGIVSLVDSSSRVSAATAYLKDDSELATICRNDGEGDPDLDARLAHLHHGLCTLENPLWYSHRRSVMAHKKREGRMLGLIVQEG